MQYKIGSKTVNLDAKDLKGTGGEGSVYVKGSNAYKIYHDRNKMLPVGKIQELSVINDSHVVKPLEVVSDSHGPVGYSMKATPMDTYVLCQYFPKAFRTRFGLDNVFSNALVENIRKSVSNIHDAGVLLVDLNEMNFLFSSNKPDVYFIDVDSYQTPHYHASALMESIRDRHAKPNEFNTGTDWFAFAIVSFQIYTGIHPYKGKHSSLKTLDERMTANISVLNSSVNVPGACIPFDVIPSNYLEWYTQVLEKGVRCAPPNTAVAGVFAVKSGDLISNGTVTITNILRASSDIVDYCNGFYVCAGCVFDSRGIKKASSLAGEVRLFESKNGVAAAHLHNGILHIIDTNTGNDISSEMSTKSMSLCDDMLVYQSGEYLYAADLLSVGKNVIFQHRVIANVLPMGTQLFDGVAMQDLLGAKYATIITKDGTHQVKLDNLSGCRIISAKYQRSVLMVVAEHNGVYNRYIYRFDSQHQKYDSRIISDVGVSEVNFCVLDSGMCLHFHKDDTLEILPNKINHPNAALVTDNAINNECRLFAVGNKAMYFYRHKIDQFSRV